jgi:N utilization substance protein B
MAQPRRTDTADPRASRLAALHVLYEADVRLERPADVLDRYLTDASASERARRREVDADPDLAAAVLDAFAVSLVQGVIDQQADIDARISRLSRGWRLERMPAIDRNVLRLAIRELLAEATPMPIVLDEAVRMASELSTDSSGRFVNGVLAAVVRELATSAERVVSDEELPPAPDEDDFEVSASPADEVARLGLELALEDHSESVPDAQSSSSADEARGSEQQG